MLLNLAKTLSEKSKISVKIYRWLFVLISIIPFGYFTYPIIGLIFKIKNEIRCSYKKIMVLFFAPFIIVIFNLINYLTFKHYNKLSINMIKTIYLFNMFLGITFFYIFLNISFKEFSIKNFFKILIGKRYKIFINFLIFFILIVIIIFYKFNLNTIVSEKKREKYIIYGSKAKCFIENRDYRKTKQVIKNKKLINTVIKQKIPNVHQFYLNKEIALKRYDFIYDENKNCVIVIFMFVTKDLQKKIDKYEIIKFTNIGLNSVRKILIENDIKILKIIEANDIFVKK